MPHSHVHAHVTQERRKQTIAETLLLAEGRGGSMLSHIFICERMKVSFSVARSNATGSCFQFSGEVRV